MKKEFCEKFLKIFFTCENLSFIGFWKVPASLSSLSSKIIGLGLLTSVHLPVFLLHHTSDSSLRAFSC